MFQGESFPVYFQLQNNDDNSNYQLSDFVRIEVLLRANNRQLAQYSTAEADLTKKINYDPGTGNFMFPINKSNSAKWPSAQIICEIKAISQFEGLENNESVLIAQFEIDTVKETLIGK